MTDISQHLQTMNHAIQFALESHRVTGQNLANINTPNYKASQVSFQQFLTQVESGEGNDMGKMTLERVQGLTERVDGNNVDLERELAALKKNAMAYQTLTQLLGSKMGIIQRAMTG